MEANTISSSNDEHVTVVGGGLAGSEAALQLARYGVDVTLLEMRPGRESPAHHTSHFAELVCSNSFKSDDASAATGSLKDELRLLRSILIEAAEHTRVAAGSALAVDREAFAAEVSDLIETSPRIEVVRDEATSLPSGRTILATGPLTSPGLEPVLDDLVGGAGLSFFDAAAPIIEGDSVDMSVAFKASRNVDGPGDYINCPMSPEEYERFIEALTAARTVVAKEFESKELFQGCQPIEEVARRGDDAIRYGALKPVGLVDPRSGEQPWAVVQLRPENTPGTAYNLVGFQTNLTFPEQERVFAMIPGLADARYLRYGVMHRNTFIDAPRHLDATLAVRSHPRVRIAGQLSGTEGYTEAIATGLLAALNTIADIRGTAPLVLPRTTALGALIAYASDPATKPYQPAHVNWGLVPPLDPPVSGKRRRYAAYGGRARQDLETYLADHALHAEISAHA